MENHKLINQDSGVQDYFTPAFIVEAAREVMGNIHLDPASCEAANEIVKAGKIYTKKENALIRAWISPAVWMNHPFSKGESVCMPGCKKKTCILRGCHVTEPIPSNADWIKKLTGEFKRGNIDQAMCITFASTSEAWFNPLFDHAMCFLQPRLNYLGPGGETNGATKGSVVTYLHRRIDQLDKFSKVFKPYGRVVVPIRQASLLWEVV